MIENSTERLANSKGLNVIEEKFGFSIRESGNQIKFCFNEVSLNNYLESYVKKIHANDCEILERIITCPSCRQKIRLKLPLSAKIGKCSNCSTRFELSIDNNDNIYITKLEEPNNKNEKDIEVFSLADCFSIFEIESSATSKEIKLSYKNKMKDYHPDKAEKLGSKIREVAAKESRNLNIAYSMLKKHGYV